jgi:thioredoxin reductase (NADPH)
MYAKTLIIASGTTETKLGVRGENEYLQKGISYCVLCDGILAKNCKTAVIGSNQSAVGSVKYLAGIASKLYFVVLDESIDVSDVPNNVEIIKGSKISLFSGNGRALTSMLLSGAVSKEIMIDYAFIINGISASTDFINNKELLTNDNIIKVDNSNKNTAIPGIFSAGDVSRSSNKQVVTAVSDGAIAATSAIAYINSKFKK